MSTVSAQQFRKRTILDWSGFTSYKVYAQQIGRINHTEFLLVRTNWMTVTHFLRSQQHRKNRNETCILSVYSGPNIFNLHWLVLVAVSLALTYLRVVLWWLFSEISCLPFCSSRLKNLLFLASSHCIQMRLHFSYSNEICMAQIHIRSKYLSSMTRILYICLFLQPRRL